MRAKQADSTRNYEVSTAKAENGAVTLVPVGIIEAHTLRQAAKLASDKYGTNCRVKHLPKREAR